MLKTPSQAEAAPVRLCGFLCPQFSVAERAANKIPSGNMPADLVTVLSAWPPSQKWRFQRNHKDIYMKNTLIVGDSVVKQLNGLYSLNDLHKASGGENRHRPNYFLSIAQTEELIKEIQIAGMSAIYAKPRIGTFVCRELVIAYSAWISPAFHLKVIRVFLSATDPVRTEKPKSGKYYYPKTMLNQRYFNGGTNSVRLYGAEIAHPKFISPTLDLFNRIESEGGTVDACRKEFDSMRKIIKGYTDFMESLQNQMVMVRTARY